MISPESRAQVFNLDKSQLICLPPHQRQLSHADTFDLLADFIGSLQAGQHSGLVLLPLPVNATVQWLDSVRALIDAPLLFAVNSDSVAAQQRIDREFSGERNFDFVLHPFDLEEVRSKAQGLLHRSTMAAYGAGRNELLIYRGYRFQISERRVFHGDQEMYLQPREFDLALELFRNRDCLLSREQLYSLFWRDTVSLRSRALDVCVFKIRRKLNIEPANGLMLRAVFGQGYKLHTVSPMFLR
ncbi:winged helix-turn-helix domain-containing protein [Variovorax atrisoli]|uniref:winged helix-turn-helix domain-containing protein n=1 Tax=Variovorax atrisoli TaxID=3394203 RepID=UPI001608C4AC|nr:winged helix-turn-helix domain-containing protein [Variovorax sp. BK613]MBB3639116.1 DNA-binding response OmpR family regulator [Variovorax sp. BK613]